MLYHGFGLNLQRMPKMPVGIDLFVCRCIEGGQLMMAGTPVTYPPQLPTRQPPQRG
jgi:hypothetical protein